MKRTKSELLEQVRTIIGEDTSDNALNLLSDISDTIDEYEKKGGEGDGEDWKKKYEENDAQWRQKYKERFFNNESNDERNDNLVIDEPEKEQPKTRFEELFN